MDAEVSAENLPKTITTRHTYLMRASGGVGTINEVRLGEIVRVPRTTLQSWRGEDLLRVAGTYGDREVFEAILLDIVRASYSLRETKPLWRRLGGDGLIAEFVDRCRSLDDAGRLDLVVEMAVGRVTICRDDESLIAAVRRSDATRTITVTALGDRVREARDAFWTFADGAPAGRARGQSSVGGTIKELRGA